MCTVAKVFTRMLCPGLLLAIGASQVTAQAGVDVRIRKTHLDNFTQGQNGVKYSILVDNVGDLPTSGAVTVVENLPAGLTAVSIAGSGWNCTQPAGPCTRADSLAVNSSYPVITLTANVAADAQSPLTNIAQVSTPGDTNSNNDAANDPAIVVASGSDLKITKSHSGYFFRGQTGTYILQISNEGSQSTAGTVTVTDTPPQGLTITGINGFGWTCAQPSGPCTRNDALVPGSSYPPVTVTASVANDAAANITNTAAVSVANDTNSGNNLASDPTLITAVTGCPAPESPHPYPANFNFTWTCTVAGNPSAVDVTFDPLTFVGNGDFIYVTDANDNNAPGSPFTGASLAGRTVTVLGNTVKIRLSSDASGEGYGLKVTSIVGSSPTSADLTIVKTHNGDFTQGQIGAQYNITVRNIGLSASSGTVTVTDTLPPPLTATGIAGAGWTCTQPAGPCSRGEALQPGAGYPDITLTVNVAGNAPAAVANTATVSGGGDTTPANNTTSDATNINVRPAGCVGPQGALPPGTLPESPHPYDNGATLTWTCVQPGDPSNIGVTFTDSTFLESGDLLYITDANGNNIPGSPFSGDMLTGRTITVPGKVVVFRLVSDSRRNGYGFKVSNIVNQGGAPGPDLILTKTHAGNFAQGQNATYTLVVRNVGGGPSNGQVSVADTLPAGITATGIAGPGWNCTLPGGPCMRNDALAAGASYPPITLGVSVAANAPASVTNTATVSGGGDANTTNNIAGDPTTITPSSPGLCAVLESPHPYSNDMDQTWTCTLPGNVSSLNVRFDPQTSIAPNDLIYVMDGTGANVAGSPFTGLAPAGQTINVRGNTVRIRLVTDSRRTDWGFKAGVVAVP